jgi:hypothetical protein
MQYLERLICRALAQPRQLDSLVIDPFEQVAPWPLDRPPAAPPPALLNPLAAESQPPRHDQPPSRPGLDAAESLLPATEAVPTPSLRLPPPEPPMAPAAATEAPALPAAARPQPRPAAPPAIPRPREPAQPLATADAFMRSLGIAQPTPIAQANGPAPTEPPAPSHEPQAISSPLNALSSQSPAVSLPRANPGMPGLSAAPSPLNRPPLLRPLPAAASTPPAAPARPSATLPPPPEPAPGRQRASDPPPERIVQATVVLAPPSRRLDDLAHSGGISRFGLGQS